MTNPITQAELDALEPIVLAADAKTHLHLFELKVAVYATDRTAARDAAGRLITDAGVAYADVSAGGPPPLSDAQAHALGVGKLARWGGHAERNVSGDTMEALERRGYAEVKTAGEVGLAGKPSRMVYRLTPAGVLRDLEVNAAARAAR